MEVNSPVYTYFLNKISVTDQDFLEEERFLFNLIDNTATVEELNTVFNSSKSYIKQKLEKLPAFFNIELSQSYINSYKMLYSKIKKEADCHLYSLNTPPSITAKPMLLSKACSKCSETLALDNFYLSKKYSDGYSKWCKNCLKEAKNPSTKEDHYKTCPHCKKKRRKSSYHKNSKTSDGLTKWCKFCMDKKSS